MKKKDVLSTVGRAFLNKRLDLKLQIQDVSKESQVSSVTISKLEKGELANTSVETLVKVASALGMEIQIVTL